MRWRRVGRGPLERIMASSSFHVSPIKFWKTPEEPDPGPGPGPGPGGGPGGGAAPLETRVDATLLSAIPPEPTWLFSEYKLIPLDGSWSRWGSANTAPGVAEPHDSPMANLVAWFTGSDSIGRLGLGSATWREMQIGMGWVRQPGWCGRWQWNGFGNHMEMANAWDCLTLIHSGPIRVRQLEWNGNWEWIGFGNPMFGGGGVGLQNPVPWGACPMAFSSGRFGEPPEWFLFNLWN